MIRLTAPWAFALLFGVCQAAPAQGPADTDGPASLFPGVSEPITLPPPTALPSPSTLPPPPTDPFAPPPAPPVEPEPGAIDPFRVHPRWLPEVWGVTGITLFPSGNKMAPNGETYDPLGTLNLDLNIGLLPEKKLYLFALGTFWAQKAHGGVTNPSQGNLDFSKRQFDFNLGAAWNYWGPLEARIFAYSNNNLNRGFDLNAPFGYTDGVGLENRWYLSGTNIYDLPRLNFLSIGFFPTKDMIGADGVTFHPGLFLRAYLTYEFVPLHYYLYADTQMIAQSAANPRLLFFDDGFAARPFDRLPGLEFRLGVFNTVDVQVDNVRTLIYFTAQVLF
jgi:hypothetical protein